MDKKNNLLQVKTLDECLLEHRSSQSDNFEFYQNLFYHLDLTMKNLHHSGYYINNFNVHDIHVASNENSDVMYIKFNNISRLYYEDRNIFIRKNIYYLSCLAIGSYNDCLNYINPNRPDTLKNNFTLFSPAIPSDVLPYYRGIIERDASVYLSDYVIAKKKRDDLLHQSDNSATSEQSSYSHTYVKSTAAGLLFTDENNKAAFALVYLFPVIIIFLSILVPLLIILST